MPDRLRSAMGSMPYPLAPASRFDGVLQPTEPCVGDFSRPASVGAAAFHAPNTRVGVLLILSSWGLLGDGSSTISFEQPAPRPPRGRVFWYAGLRSVKSFTSPAHVFLDEPRAGSAWT